MAEQRPEFNAAQLLDWTRRMGVQGLDPAHRATAQASLALADRVLHRTEPRTVTVDRFAWTGASFVDRIGMRYESADSLLRTSGFSTGFERFLSSFTPLTRSYGLDHGDGSYRFFDYEGLVYTDLEALGFIDEVDLFEDRVEAGGRRRSLFAGDRRARPLARRAGRSAPTPRPGARSRSRTRSQLLPATGRGTLLRPELGARLGSTPPASGPGASPYPAALGASAGFSLPAGLRGIAKQARSLARRHGGAPGPRGHLAETTFGATPSLRPAETPISAATLLTLPPAAAAAEFAAPAGRLQNPWLTMPAAPGREHRLDDLSLRRRALPALSSGLDLLTASSHTAARAADRSLTTAVDFRPLDPVPVADAAAPPRSPFDAALVAPPFEPVEPGAPAPLSATAPRRPSLFGAKPPSTKGSPAWTLRDGVPAAVARPTGRSESRQDAQSRGISPGFPRRQAPPRALRPVVLVPELGPPTSLPDAPTLLQDIALPGGAAPALGAGIAEAAGQFATSGRPLLLSRAQPAARFSLAGAERMLSSVTLAPLPEHGEASAPPPPADFGEYLFVAPLDEPGPEATGGAESDRTRTHRLVSLAALISSQSETETAAAPVPLEHGILARGAAASRLPLMLDPPAQAREARPGVPAARKGSFAPTAGSSSLFSDRGPDLRLGEPATALDLLLSSSGGATLGSRVGFEARPSSSAGSTLRLAGGLGRLSKSIEARAALSSWGLDLLEALAEEPGGAALLRQGDRGNVGFWQRLEARGVTPSTVRARRLRGWGLDATLLDAAGIEPSTDLGLPPSAVPVAGRTAAATPAGRAAMDRAASTPPPGVGTPPARVETAPTRVGTPPTRVETAPTRVETAPALGGVARSPSTAAASAGVRSPATAGSQRVGSVFLRGVLMRAAYRAGFQPGDLMPRLVREVSERMDVSQAVPAIRRVLQAEVLANAVARPEQVRRLARELRHELRSGGVDHAVMLQLTDDMERGEAAKAGAVPGAVPGAKESGWATTSPLSPAKAAAAPPQTSQPSVRTARLARSIRRILRSVLTERAGGLKLDGLRWEQGPGLRGLDDMVGRVLASRGVSSEIGGLGRDAAWSTPEKAADRYSDLGAVQVRPWLESAVEEVLAGELQSAGRADPIGRAPGVSLGMALSRALGRGGEVSQRLRALLNVRGGGEPGKASLASVLGLSELSHLQLGGSGHDEAADGAGASSPSSGFGRPSAPPGPSLGGKEAAAMPLGLAPSGTSMDLGRLSHVMLRPSAPPAADRSLVSPVSVAVAQSAHLKPNDEQVGAQQADRGTQKASDAESGAETVPPEVIEHLSHEIATRMSFRMKFEQERRGRWD